jgi:hypothetical protein
METTEVDYEKIAERYGISVEEVKDKLDKNYRSILKELEGVYSSPQLEAEASKYNVAAIPTIFQLEGLRLAKDKAAKGLLDTAGVIILGVSPPEDGNSYKMWKQKEEYKKLLNKKEKTEDDIVKMNSLVKLGISETNGKEYPIALDSEAMIERKDKDGNKTIETNPNFGQPIPKALKISVPFILCALNDSAKEEFLMGSMRWDKTIKNLPDVGKMSTVYGKQHDPNKPYFTINKDAYEGEELYKKAFDVAMRVLPSTEFWMDLPAIDDAPISVFNEDKGKNTTVYTKFAATGMVQKVQIQEFVNKDNKKEHKVSVTVGDIDMPTGLKLSTRYEPVVAYVHENIAKGDDVIVMGCKKSFMSKDKTTQKVILDDKGNPVMIPYYELWGIIKSFSGNDEIAEMLRSKGLV